MSYRSYVKILIRNDLLADLKKKYEEQKFANDLFEMADEERKSPCDNFTIVGWNSICWDSWHYAGTKFIEDYIKNSKDAQFIRCGEEMNDNEEICNLNTYGGWGLGVNREIIIDDILD